MLLVRMFLCEHFKKKTVMTIFDQRVHFEMTILVYHFKTQTSKNIFKFNVWCYFKRLRFMSERWLVRQTVQKKKEKI